MPHPRIAIYGQKGKVERYYWREIYKTYCKYTLEWLNQKSETVKDILEFQEKFPDIAKELEKRAKKHWQSVAKQNPKYDMKETAEAEFLFRNPLPEVQISTEYRQIEKRSQKIGKWVSQDGSLSSVEQIATEYYVSKGYSVKDWSSKNRGAGLVEILLPEDFGSAKFYERRKSGIMLAVDNMRNAEDLIIVFDRLLEDSESLRDYLWVNKDEAVNLDRTALEILPKDVVISSIDWAIQDFWQRQPGWPDLFVFVGNEYKFVEVKSPFDKLSQEQMQWFEWAGIQRIPCEILRVKRRK